MLLLLLLPQVRRQVGAQRSCLAFAQWRQRARVGSPANSMLDLQVHVALRVPHEQEAQHRSCSSAVGCGSRRGVASAAGGSGAGCRGMVQGNTRHGLQQQCHAHLDIQVPSSEWSAKRC